MYDTLYELIKWFIQILVGIGLINVFIYFIIAPWYNVKEKWRRTKVARHRSRPYVPSLSVIVPAWNEEVGILKTVKSLLANRYPQLEIVVVNDGSTDRTDEIMKSFIVEGVKSRQFDEKTVKYIYQKNGGKGVALNTGIKNARGEIILTMDADSAISEGGLWNLVRYFEDPEIMGVVGNVKVANNSTWVGLVQKLEYIFGFYFKRAHALLGAEYIFGGACAAYRASVFDQIGLFDEHNKTEDIEMSMRTRYYGMQCTYAEDVVVYTEGASSHQGLLNQRLRWKKGRFDTFAKYAKLFFSTEERHNSSLSFWILPLAMVGEILLFLAPLALSLLLAYSVITQDYISLAFNILFLGFFYLVNAVFAREKNIWILLMFPFTWIIFYYLVWVEYMALMKSLYMFIRGDQVVWQKWKRVGIGKEINS